MLTSKHVKDIDNKAAMLKTSVEESDLAISADYLTKKQSLTLVSDDVIKICRDRLDSSDLTSSPTPGLPPDKPNLNKKNKRVSMAII